MVNVPCPAVVGLNVLPVTPVPENVPPAGLPVNVTGAAFTQSGPTGVIVTVGNGFTVTVTVAVLLHPAVVPVTVYVVVAPGLAVTVAPVVADSPVAGDQLYVVAPVAVSVVAAPPAQIATFGDTPTVG